MRFILALCLFVGAAQAAPVPPQPKELTFELLVGEWDYRYGSIFGAKLWLCPDGTLVSRYGTEDAPSLYVGVWRVENGNTLVLCEHAYSGISGVRFGQAEVSKLVIDPKTYSNPQGKCEHRVVSLTNRKLLTP